MPSNPKENDVTIDDTSRLAAQLAKLGYEPIPNIDKVTYWPAWNAADYAGTGLPNRAKGWPRAKGKAIGLRVVAPLEVIDSDIDDPLGQQFLDGLETLAPEVYARAPCRYGASPHKFALFCSTPAEGDEAFGIMQSRQYFAGTAEQYAAAVAAHEAGGPPVKTHRVEVFGNRPSHNGKVGKQVGVWGPHSHNTDGSVRARYRFDEQTPALLDQPPAGLPPLGKTLGARVLQLYEGLAEAAGWYRIENQAGTAADRLFIIDDDTRFEVQGRGLLAYEDLQDGMRCTASFIDGKHHDNETRCHVGWSDSRQCITVHDYGNDTTYYPKTLAPPPNKIAEALKQLQQEQAAPAPAAKPDATAGVVTQSLWLLQNYGFYALDDAVVELPKASDECQIKPQAFNRLYRAWREEEIGPMGGRKFIYATGYWEVNPYRINIEGIRMRPDMPFPTYVERGLTYKNTYQPPQHAGRGDIQTWHDFMVHLLPAPEERECFCNWLAHKHRNPGIPGFAVVMVATGPDGPVYGAGRGMLRDIIARLLGPDYVRPIDFDVFTGKSAQGVYTDWGAYATMVTVNEARDTESSGRWNERRAVYERIKELVDPRPIDRTFTSKGRPAFRARACASYLIFSNNRDALQVPDDDRRTAVFNNGTRLPAEAAQRLQTWMDQPGNIAELARWLEARDLTGFDVYAPPMTGAKGLMQKLARTDLDDAFKQVRKLIGPRGLFTGRQVLDAVRMDLGDNFSSETLKQVVRRFVRSEAETFPEEFRMPPAKGRGRILHWRNAKIDPAVTEFRARLMAEHTGQTLARGHATEGDVVDMPTDP